MGKDYSLVTTGTISSWNITPLSYGNMPITITQKITHRDFSFVELSVDMTQLTGESKRIKVTGLAKRNPVDKTNKELSDALAMSRAFTSLTKRLEKRTAGMMKHQDDVIDMKEALKKPKAKKAPAKK